jgi:type 1 glutamine amidotransferase
MRRLIAPVIAVLGLVSLVATSPRAPAGEPAAKRKILYLTHSAGFKHPVLPVSEEVFRELGDRYGFDATITQDCSLLTADSLKNYDAVVFYTTGELPISEDQKAAFLSFIKSGNGFVGVHSATDTFYKWPAYGELIGGYFDGHPWNTEVNIKVEDQKHPSTKHLGASFKLADEIYQFKNYNRARVRVLLSLDTSSVDMTKAGIKRTDGDFALAWSANYGKGRMFYTALGHRPEVWRDERFQKHLIGGLRWAVGDEK